MLAVIEVTSGARRGWRVPFRAGQVVRVGQTDWADLCIPEDETLQAIHFALCADGEKCLLQPATAEAETLVNQEEVVGQCPLQSGDVITAGNTTFLIHVEAASKPAGGSEDETSQEGEKTVDIYDRQGNMRKVCAFAELGEGATELATEQQSPRELIDLFMANKDFDAAMKLQCFWMPKPLSVAWAARCVRATMEQSLPENQRAALESAEQWAADPTEENRRNAETFSNSRGSIRVGSFLALAAFASGGSLGVEGQETVAPDERITAQVASGAIAIAAFHGDPTAAPDRFEAFLADARNATEKV